MVVATSAVNSPRTNEVRKARMIASFSNSVQNQRSENPSIGKPPNCEALKASNSTTKMGANMKV